MHVCLFDNFVNEITYEYFIYLYCYRFIFLVIWRQGLYSIDLYIFIQGLGFCRLVVSCCVREVKHLSGHMDLMAILLSPCYYFVVRNNDGWWHVTWVFIALVEVARFCFLTCESKRNEDLVGTVVCDGWEWDRANLHYISLFSWGPDMCTIDEHTWHFKTATDTWKRCAWGCENRVTSR
jgi:hypothetical protein